MPTLGLCVQRRKTAERKSIMKGRRPTPTHLRLVRGNPGKRPVNPAEPTPKKGVSAAPKHLTGAAKAAWLRFSEHLAAMGVLTDADSAALERVSALYAEILLLGAALATHGHVYETVTETGSTIFRPRPEVAMLADADRRFRAYLVEFGLTPAARSRVKTDGSGEKEDPAAKYFG